MGQRNSYLLFSLKPSSSQCENSACWGQNERVLQIRRKWRNIPNGFTGYEMLMTNSKVLLNGKDEEVLDRTFVRPDKTTYNPYYFEGISLVNTKALGVPALGFPSLVDQCEKKGSYFMHFGIYQYPKDGEMANECYYPQKIIIEYFKQDETFALFR